MDTKYQFSWFSSFDYKRVESNLSVMAAKGWEIEQIGASLWRFKKSIPSNRKFCVVFSTDGSDHSPVLAENQKLLEDLHRKDGWKKIAQRKQMQIFCADDKTASPEVDETMRIESVCIAMKKAFIPIWTTALFIALSLAFSMGIRYFVHSPHRAEDTGWTFLIALYAVFITGFALLVSIFWLKISRKKISGGGACINTAWPDRLMNVLHLGFWITVIGVLINSSHYCMFLISEI